MQNIVMDENSNRIHSSNERLNSCITAQKKPHEVNQEKCYISSGRTLGESAGCIKP